MTVLSLLSVTDDESVFFLKSNDLIIKKRVCVKHSLSFCSVIQGAKRRIYLDEMTGDVLNEVNLLSLCAGEEMLHYVLHDRMIGLSAF